jgi:acetaldehyde dehydrogenase
MVARVQEYVPGYQLRAEPQFDDPRPEWRGLGRVAVFLQVSGNGDYLPPWAGNLDIMTAAAAEVGELIAQRAEKATGASVDSVAEPTHTAANEGGTL